MSRSMPTIHHADPALQVPRPSFFGAGAAWFSLIRHSGLHRHSHLGRVRVGHFDGEEARNAKRDIPRAVLLSLGIQGIFCYLIEYFAANYFLNQGYTMTNAAGSGAPLGDMM